MVNSQLLAVLRCPEDGSPLAPADDAVVARLNAAIRARRVQNRAGRRLKKTVDAGLIRTAGDLLYPIVDQIPILLTDESIPLGDLAAKSQQVPALDS